MKILTKEQMRQAEKNSASLGLNEATLMENAGQKAYDFIIDTLGKDINYYSCVILCGSGNNGGDGFVVARKLRKFAMNVKIVLVDSIPKTKDAALNYDKCKDLNIEILDCAFDFTQSLNAISNANLIVDAVYGIGFHGSLPERTADIFDCVNKTNAFKVSLDLPSGVSADTGEADAHTFKADLTITFGAAKLCHILSPAKTLCGKIKVADIGLNESVFDNIGTVIGSITESQLPAILPDRKENSHKGDYGKLLIIAGHKNMSGAAALSTLSALRCGVGLCTLASTKTVIDRTASNIYEPIYITLPENENGGISREAISGLEKVIPNYDTICFGMGMGNTPDTKDLLANVLNLAKGTIIIDADGINALSSCINLCKDTEAKIILTPHPGEMSRLTGKTIGEIEENRIETAKQFACENNVTLVLKGSATVISTPKGEVYLNSTGNAGLSRGGSGDVLSGIIGALSAQGMNPLIATLTGVFLHGKCADVLVKEKGKMGMLPTDIINTIPSLFAKYGK